MSKPTCRSPRARRWSPSGRSSDSSRSRVFACTSSNSVTFWMAIAAWSAKVLSRSICLSLNGLTSLRRMTSAPIASPSRIKGVGEQSCDGRACRAIARPRSETLARLSQIVPPARVSRSNTARPVTQSRVKGKRLEIEWNGTIMRPITQDIVPRARADRLHHRCRRSVAALSTTPAGPAGCRSAKRR